MEISAWKRVQKSFIRSAHPISTFLEIYFILFFQETACVFAVRLFSHTWSQQQHDNRQHIN